MNDITTTMKLNHLSFPSNDIAATTRFFVDHLGCAATEYPGMSMVRRPGFDIVIEQAKDFQVEWPHNFHVGFELPSAEDVRTVYDRLKADGVEMRTEVFSHDRGSRFFCVAPGGLLFEINTRADAKDFVRG